MESALLKNGWTKSDKKNFKEKVVVKTTFCFTYVNGQKTGIALFGTEDSKRILVRIYGIENKDFNYFELEFKDFESVANKIVEIQDETAIENYFSFYMALQSVCDISILAWEQWEENYK